MSEENYGAKHVENAPRAQVQTKRGFSIIWVVPIVALIIGGVLAFKAFTEKGPTITISFENADGLAADKTMVKYKDVDIGKVTAIELLKDLSGVVVTVEMHKDAEQYLTENTRFWVVRARVAAGEVSGLGTLFSGAYIGCSPSMEGKQQRQYDGLEKPPVLTEGLPGQHYVLEAKTLGSLDLGSPVYYRGIKVGQVVEYDFDETAEAVLLKVFINDPYHKKVRKNTRFWNASGIDMTMDATGVQLNTESLVSIMLGGIAFDLRQHDRPAAAAGKDEIFLLFPNKERSEEDTYTEKTYYTLYFDQSVRGLSPGAPVEVHGLQIGEVVHVELQFDMKKLDFRIPVQMYIEPERFQALVTESGEIVKGAEKEEVMDENRSANKDPLVYTRALVEKGLRAQLKTGNLLTGQLYIDLDFYPDAPPAKLVMEDEHVVFPTVPAPLEQIVQRVDTILKKVEKVPFDKIGQDLQVALAELNNVLKEVKGISGKVNEETMPKVNATLDDLQETLKGIESTLGPDSALNYNARQVTAELATTIRSIRSLLEYLERDPQALLLGKEGETQ